MKFVSIFFCYVLLIKSWHLCTLWSGFSLITCPGQLKVEKTMLYAAWAPAGFLHFCSCNWDYTLWTSLLKNETGHKQGYSLIFEQPLPLKPQLMKQLTPDMSKPGQWQASKPAVDLSRDLRGSQQGTGDGSREGSDRQRSQDGGSLFKASASSPGPGMTDRSAQWEKRHWFESDVVIWALDHLKWWCRCRHGVFPRFHKFCVQTEPTAFPTLNERAFRGRFKSAFSTPSPTPDCE